MRAHERLAHIAVVRVLRGCTALQDEPDHRCRRSPKRHEARLAARRARDTAMTPTLASHHARVTRDDRAPELLVVAHDAIVERWGRPLESGGQLRHAGARTTATPP